MKKQRYFWYKDDCHPRIFINPNEETIQMLKEEGTLLRNPNDGSVKGLPLVHTFPDVDNNMIRPLPVSQRKEVKVLENPLKMVRWEKQQEDKITINNLNYKVEKLQYQTERGIMALQTQIYNEKVKAREFKIAVIVAFSMYSIIQGFVIGGLIWM